MDQPALTTMDRPEMGDAAATRSREISRRRVLFCGFLILLAVPLVAGATFSLVLGAVPALQLHSRRMTLAASFIHFGILGWAGAIVLTGLASLVARRAAIAVMIVPLAVGLLWQLSWIAPYYRADPVPHSEPMGLAVINVEDGIGNVDEFVRAISGADVVVIVEVTDSDRAALQKQGFGKAYPYQVHQGSGVPGTAIYSRHRIDNLGPGQTRFGSPLVRVHHPGGPILVQGAHPVNPIGGQDIWYADAVALRENIRPHLSEPLVVAGDFNAIDRQMTMRPLFEQDGFRSSADLTAAGYQRTWPVGGFAKGLRVPFPLIGIDYVLVNPKMTATSHRIFRISGTDHAGLFVEVAHRV